MPRVQVLLPLPGKKRMPKGVRFLQEQILNQGTRSVSRGAGLRWRPLHTKYAEAPTEPAGETKSFCPCQKETVTVLVTVSFFVRQNLSEARACRASSPSAAGGRCSEARMAQRSKYGVTPPYFGHRKRGCEATSSPFVYLRQSYRDNHCFCFTAIGVLSE